MKVELNTKNGRVKLVDVENGRRIVAIESLEICLVNGEEAMRLWQRDAQGVSRTAWMFLKCDVESNTSWYECEGNVWEEVADA